MFYLSENLKKYRLLKKLTQEDVAEYLGITSQSVSKWERGESYPDITFLPALANILKQASIYLLAWIQYGLKKRSLVSIKKLLHISDAEIMAQPKKHTEMHY